MWVLPPEQTLPKGLAMMLSLDILGDLSETVPLSVEVLVHCTL